MPANGLSGAKKYYHVFNRGVEGRTIFADAEDYQTFESYLASYLSPAVDPKSVQKTFTVNGRTFKGTPHQPKNYHGKIELIAYSLMPDHFHLILQVNANGQLEGLIRSLGTRYSMYFNKKYHRKGSLFEGPYKSVEITEASRLLPLANYIHHGDNEYSSYREYSGSKETSWVNKNIALSAQSSGNSESEKDLIKGLTIEEEGSQNQPLERRDLAASEPKEPPKPQNTSRWPEVAALTVVFVLLTGLSLRNIQVSQAKSPTTTISNNTEPSQNVLSATSDVTQESTPSAEPTTEPQLTVVVKLAAGYNSTNIRSAPDVSAEKIGEAKNGESYEVVSTQGDWYEVKLDNGLTGFIYSKSTYIQQND